VPRAIVAAIQEAWGCRVFQHYGMTEMGFGGGVECAAHAGYHLREADLLFEIVDPVTGGPHTAHTTNPVPVILVGGPAGARLRDGKLADLAPTLLQLMGLPQPAEMTGKTLII
jgi:hypothetical protein